MIIQSTMSSILAARRSRSPALALARVSGPHLDRKVDPTPVRGRIEVSCLHKLLGIAPQKLLFRANVKRDRDLSWLTNRWIQSAVLTKRVVVCDSQMLTGADRNSVAVIDVSKRRQKLVILATQGSPFVRKVGF